MGNIRITATIKGIHQGKIRPDPDIPFMKIDENPGVTAILYTIGYGNRLPPTFIEILQKANVQIIIDVRRAGCRSWNRTYWPDRLEELLNESNIAYRHWYNLGNYWSLEAYAELIGREALEPYVKKLKSIGLITCLLCAELDPLKCHRSILADKLVEILGDRWKVVHL